MDFFSFIDNAALLLALSLLSTNIQFRWLKREPDKSILLGILYGFFAVLAMIKPMVLQPGVIFDGRSVILGLAGLFTGNLTTAIACLIAAIARYSLGGQGVFTGIGSVVIAGASGLVFRRIVDKKDIRLNLSSLFTFGFGVHLVLIFWFFTLPSEIAKLVIRNVALPYLVVFPLTTMLIGGLILEQLERLETEKELAASEKRYRDLVNTLNEGVWEIDANMVTTFINPKMAGIIGLSPEEVIGRPVSEFISKDQLDKYEEVIEHRRKGIKEQYEIKLVGKNGEIINALVGATPLFDEKGNFAGSLSGIQDISDLKRAQEILAKQSRLLEEKVEERTRDLKNAQEQLLKAEKLAVLGELAGSVGHELRNPLAVILNSTYLLKNKSSLADTQTKEYIEMIEKETYNATHIINDLLDYSRIQPTAKEPVDLTALIADLLAELPIPNNINIENRLSAEPLMVNVNPQQLNQIITNLITNAWEAMPEGGSLILTAVAKKEKVVVFIKDTGVGIPAKNLKRLFEPLFTTKPRGIGLGLAITSKLAGLNDIKILVKSKVGQGTTFTLEFLKLVSG
jgi:PAS domain S-box-containing protein